jgi:hypothetical protein
MTPEQLKALMEWINLRCEQVCAGEKGWRWDDDVKAAQEKLYESFEFSENAFGDPVKD